MSVNTKEAIKALDDGSLKAKQMFYDNLGLTIYPQDAYTWYAEKEGSLDSYPVTEEQKKKAFQAYAIHKLGEEQ